MNTRSSGSGDLRAQDVVSGAVADRHALRRTLLLDGPILSTVVRLSWPNVIIMVAQAATGLIETWYLSRLGTDVLAAMAIVFPVLMLMQTVSGGAFGGGISSAIARAIGGDRRDEADALVLHAIVLTGGLGLVCSVVILSCGPSLYRALGGEGASLSAALTYSNVVFLGMPVLWIMNALAAVIRGTGNLTIPAIGMCGGVLILVPLSPLLIFGIGPFPRIGVAGGGVALLLYYFCGALFFGWYILSGRNAARFRWVRLRAQVFSKILRVGALAALSSVVTNATIASATALIGHRFGAAEVAGFGTGARLEYLLVPLVFGVGGTLVAMVGMNVGAARGPRARSIALIGGAVCFVMTEGLGLTAAFVPALWLRLFGSDPAMIAAGSTYLRVVGPFYGLYGFGFALYFANQGAGTLLWPVLGGLARLLLVAGGGWFALTLTGSVLWLFAAIAAGLVMYGLILTGWTIRADWGRRGRS
ncbi:MULTISPECIES: MATE family efflux transporter [unclassified Caballeronia]|uniref:MATE family efflux transporter n=1 Tax=unclassified Caballeronia TaxID=2646786 RepID=UPI0028651A0C|nr:MULTISPECIES: MATE family efflux transporter [unclassified Caballeronia]MDR5741151.1 MATE family efflux transporter [Caballeronia sp. LZ016]MDR5807051.1 MATE family efflux transporter [Caballeronia sp. LZ019]